MRHLTIRFALACLCVAAAPTLPAKGPAPTTTTAADDAFARGDLQAAETAYRVTKGNHTMLRLAQLALWSNRLDEARHLAERVLKATPDDKAAAGILAEAHYRANRFAEASHWFRRAEREAKAELTALFAGRTPYAREHEAVIELPFVHTDPLPMVNARIGDETVNLIIDTGGAELLLSPEVAQRAGAEMAATVAQGTFAGGKRAPVAFGRLPGITLGSVEIADVPINVLDTAKFAVAGNGKPVHGVIGAILLYQFRPTFDYRNGKLVLNPRGSNGRGRDSDGTPFWLLGDHYMVARGNVEKAPEGLYFIDTGAAGLGLALTPKTLEEAGIQIDAAQTTTGVGGGGTISIVPFLAKRATLGTDMAENILGVAGAFPSSLEHGFGVRLHGLVSHAYFRQATLEIDFDSMRLRILR